MELAPLQSSFVSSPPPRPSPHRSLTRRGAFLPAGLPLLSFLLLEHTAPGAPLHLDAARELALVSDTVVGEGCHALTGAVLRVGSLATVLAAPGTEDPVRSPECSCAPEFRGLVPCRSRSWSFPSELSLLGEPCPLSRAVASLRVRVRRSPARSRRTLRMTFTRRADPLPRLDHGCPWLAGRMGRDNGSPSR